MRDQLIGYLLDALEASEHEQVEAHLSRDPQLQRELDLLVKCLAPLAADKAHYEPPAGLAQRTCEFVVYRAAQVSVSAAAPEYSPRRWSMADMVVAAGIFLAAMMLFFPAMSQSRFAARLTGCQNNLRQFGMAMANYSMAHHGFFPAIPLEGRLAVVGTLPSRLHALGFLEGTEIAICPASSLADQGTAFRLPTLAEVEAADGNALVRLHQQIGGSYGYYLGYVADGRYQWPKNLRRPRFALVADAPTFAPPYRSLNHNGCGQNVLFEDGHVQYLTTCRARGCRDDIYTNDHGVVGPGLHVNDAVIGPSPARPRMVVEVIEIRAGQTK